MKNVCRLLIGMLIILPLLTACGSGGGGSSSVASTNTSDTSNTVDTGDSGETTPISPSTPSGLTAVVSSDKKITLSWNASTDDGSIFGYTVTGGNPSQVQSFNTSYTFTELTAETQYCLSVQAIDNEGNLSSPSEPSCYSTQAAPAATSWSIARKGVKDSLEKIVWSGSKLLAISPYNLVSEVQLSEDGTTWNTYTNTGIYWDSYFSAATYGDGKFVAFSTYSHTSTDGISWTMTNSTTNTATDALDIAWSPTLALFVSSGFNGELFYSADGVQWTQATHGLTTQTLNYVEWLNDRFIAVGEGNTILSSPDGINWALLMSSGTGALRGVAWNGKSGIDSAYVTMGSDEVFTSNDGVSWSQANLTTNNTFNQVIWGGGSANLFVAVGYMDQIYTSPDGVNWSAHDIAHKNSVFYDAVWTGTYFAIVGTNGIILTSNDGLAWTPVAFGGDYAAVEWDGSRFVAVGENGRIATSSNSLDWTYSTMGDDRIYVSSITWNSNQYVAVGASDSVFSTDFTTWAGKKDLGYRGIANVIWDGSQFVGINGVARVWDGSSLQTGSQIPDWKISLNVTEELYAIHWDGSQYVVVGGNGKIYTATDISPLTANWTARTSGVTNRLHSIIKANNTYLAVGDNGTIITSPDAVTWTVQNTATTQTLNDIVWTGNEYIAVGWGNIVTSPDAVNWSEYILDYDVTETNLISVTAGNGSVVAVGEDGTIMRRAI